MTVIHNEWKVPQDNSPEDSILGWIQEAIQEGSRFLEMQRAYEDFDVAIDSIAGRDMVEMPSYRSKVRANRTKRQIREVVSTLSDLRPLWGYKTDNRDLYKQTGVLNNLLLGWYLNTFADRKIRTAIQYASVLGTAYARPIWQKDLWIAGRGDIDLQCYGPRDVLFVQLPKDKNLQRAYAVLIRNEVPIAIAHAMHPDFQDKIVPDRNAPSSMKRGMKRVMKFASPVLNLLGRKKEDPEQVFPTVDIWHCYILDQTINMSGSTMPMGTPGTSWYYEVPSYNSDIPDRKNSAGQMTYRKATHEDSMLYPNRRLIMATRTCKLYDGPGTDWHGMVPLVKFEVDDWPWEALGFSLVRDIQPLNDEHTETLRSMADRERVRAQPPLQYDTNVVPKSVAERLDTRRPNSKIGLNMQMGEGFKTVIPPEYYTINAEEFTWLEKLETTQDYLIGVRDVVAMAKARAASNPDALEKMMELAGPIVKDISRGMEQSLRDMGEMVKTSFFQFYTAARRVQLLGEDGVTEQDFDYEPGNMVPSHMPDENKDDGQSRRTYLERARYYSKNFYFHVTPNSLHQITQMARKLLNLQLFRGGFPIDPWTVAEACDIANFGPPPKGCSNVMERWMAWEDMKQERAIEAAQLMASMQGQAGGTGPNGGHKGQGGRAPSGQAPPTIRQKDGGTRSTITESK